MYRESPVDCYYCQDDHHYSECEYQPDHEGYLEQLRDERRDMEL